MKKLNRNNMKALNEKEFKALIKTYKSMNESTFEGEGGLIPLNEITGHGSTRHCSLCAAIRKRSSTRSLDCNKCVYNTNKEDDSSLHNCCAGINQTTYDAIDDAETVNDILMAVKSRAEHMKKVWKAYKAMQKDETVQK